MSKYNTTFNTFLIYALSNFLHSAKCESKATLPSTEFLHFSRCRSAIKEVNDWDLNGIRLFPEISWKWCSAQSLDKLRIEIKVKHIWAQVSSRSGWNLWHKMWVWIKIIKNDSVWTCKVLNTFAMAYFWRIFSSSWQLTIACLKSDGKYLK